MSSQSLIFLVFRAQPGWRKSCIATLGTSHVEIRVDVFVRFFGETEMQVISAAMKQATTGGISGNSRAAEDSNEQIRSQSGVQPQRAGASSPAVTVSLSPAAVFHLSQMKTFAAPAAGPGYFAQFFLTREGYEANALGAAVADPAALSSSAGLSLEKTAEDARARMDAKYASMKDSGQPFSWQAAERRDSNALFGDHDRRSLLAVRENVGGLFTKEEQAAAWHLMNQQQGLAMGLYTGVTSQESKFHDPYGEDKVARFTATLEWLQKMSPEEKGTGEWLEQHVGVVQSLSIVSRDAEEEPEREWYSLLDLLTLKDQEREEMEELHGEKQRPAPTQPHNVLLDHAQWAYLKLADDTAG